MYFYAHTWISPAIPLVILVRQYPHSCRRAFSIRYVSLPSEVFVSRPLKDGWISELDGASDLTTPLPRLVTKASLIFRSGIGYPLSKTLTYLGENAWMMAIISSRSKASTRISAKIFFIFLVKLDIGAADLMIANLLVFSEWRNTIVKSTKKIWNKSPPEKTHRGEWGKDITCLFVDLSSLKFWSD